MADEIERNHLDGPVTVNRVNNKLIGIQVKHDGVTQDMVMSEWNARRVLGMLSVILELPLSPKAQKSIKL